jgi:hypothetical protein
MVFTSSTPCRCLYWAHVRSLAFENTETDTTAISLQEHVHLSTGGSVWQWKCFRYIIAVVCHSAYTRELCVQQFHSGTLRRRDIFTRSGKQMSHCIMPIMLRSRTDSHQTVASWDPNPRQINRSLFAVLLMSYVTWIQRRKLVQCELQILIRRTSLQTAFKRVLSFTWRHVTASSLALVLSHGSIALSCTQTSKWGAPGAACRLSVSWIIESVNCSLY